MPMSRSSHLRARRLEVGKNVLVRALRVFGLALFLYGAVMLALLFSPWKDWALDHSIAEVVSWTDRRADNQVSGSVDDPLAYAGSAVVMFAGLWFGLLVPRTLRRYQEAAGAGTTTAAPPGGSEPGGPTPS
ncbi:MAG: hypothetical protein KF703_14265 [Actinobacteria bacterium]|nr:hypothetical protein [Actinomycetota bacterium]